MAEPEVLRILHITDSHILPDPGARFYGMDTEASLRAVIRNANTRRFDLVLFTGDLVQDPVPRSYERLVAACSELQTPCYCLPGNHDDPQLVRRILRETPLKCEPVISKGAWLIICLDSTVPGSAGGSLPPEQLALLERSLTDNPERYVLIALHHHPLPCGSAWMDTMILDNSVEFMDVLARYPQVKLVLHGHTHQVSDVEAAGKRVLGTPSTCIQFKPESVAFALDAMQPGYRWLELGPAGSVATGVCRLQEPPLELDPESIGC